MLVKTNRLQKKKDIEMVFRKGRAFKEDFLVLKTAKNNLNRIRFGFIVSQKISKKANVRNRVKRKLRELARIDLKKLEPGTDNLIIALPGLETKDFWEIGETMNKLFQKAGLVK